MTPLGLASATCASCGLGEELGHPVPAPLQADQSHVELGDAVADEVVAALVPQVDLEHRTAGGDVQAGRAQQRGELVGAVGDLDGDDRATTSAAACRRR